MLRTILSLGFVQALGLVINAVRAKVFALLLGPAGFGLVATIDQLVVSAAQFSNLSVPFTALKFLSRGHSQGEEAFRRTYATFLQAILALAVAATVAAVVLIPPFVASHDPQVARYRGPVLLALLGIPAVMMQAFFANVLAARGKSLASIVFTTSFSFVVMVAGWIGCVLGGIRGLYLAAVPASLLMILGMAVFAKRRMGLPLRRPGARPWSGLEVEGGIVQTALLTYLAVCSHSALLLIARYESLTRLGEEAAGFLQAALAVVLSIGALLTSANTLHFTPYVSRDLPSAKKAEAAAAFLQRLVLLYCLAALPALVWPEMVLRLLYSSRFVAAAPVLVAFVLWQCLSQIANVYLQLLIGLDDVAGGCVITTMGSALAAALCVALTGRIGLFGVTVAFMAGAATIVAGSAWRLFHRFGLGVPGGVVALIAYGVLGLGGVGLTSVLTDDGSVTGLATRAAAAVVFLGGLWLAGPRELRAELVQGVVGRLSFLRRDSPGVSP